MRKESNKTKKAYSEPTWEYEDLLLQRGYKIIAGIDEVGRGPLAGPVVAAAVVLDRKDEISGIRDSKKLSEKKRDFFYNEIINSALSIGIGIVDEMIIDSINIRNATHLAMKKAFENLSLKPDFLLIDAETLIDIEIPQKAIIKGDSLCFSIAAASIVAKVKRDNIISKYDDIYPGYGFSKHKGYGTKQHFESIRKYGILPIHRKTFLKNI